MAGRGRPSCHSSHGVAAGDPGDWGGDFEDLEEALDVGPYEVSRSRGDGEVLLRSLPELTVLAGNEDNSAVISSDSAFHKLEVS